MMATLAKKKTLAEESLKTRKAREKLKRKLEVLEKKITPQALEKKTIEIHRWIARHASTRAVLRSKTISLFDENQNTAKLSKKVSVLADLMKKENQAHFAEPASMSGKKIFQSNLPGSSKE